MYNGFRGKWLCSLIISNEIEKFIAHLIQFDLLYFEHNRDKQVEVSRCKDKNVKFVLSLAYT